MLRDWNKMLLRDLLTFATMVSSLTAAVGASVDLDSGDYEVLADNEGKSDDNGNVTFWVDDFMGKSGETGSVTPAGGRRNDRANGCARGWRQTPTNKSMKIMELSFRSRSNFNSFVSVGVSIDPEIWHDFCAIFIDRVVPLHVVALRFLRLRFIVTRGQRNSNVYIGISFILDTCLFFRRHFIRRAIERERFVSIPA